MCGRFSLFTEFDDLQVRFQFASNPVEYKPRFNIAPSQDVLVVYESFGQGMLDSFKWGFKPSWGKAEDAGFINARCESLKEKSSFRDSFWGKRCLVLADGFFEWRDLDGKKYPYYIKMKSSKPFAFAGIYSDRTCAIVTTEPNEVVSPIHDRMPVILKRSDEGYWMDCENHDVDELEKILLPYPGDFMHSYPISKKVNDVGYDSFDVLEKTQILKDVMSQKRLDDFF